MSLAAEGLSTEQLVHFAEHGWVLLENMLDEHQCEQYIDAIDRTLATIKKAYQKDDPYGTQHLAFFNPHLRDQVFVDWFKIPGLLEANRQLIGHSQIRFAGSFASTGDPHPDRHARHDEIADPETWGWHRDFRPRWIIQPHESDPRLINASLIVTATYFTPHSPERGATALLDGSHLRDGVGVGADIYNEMKEEHPLVHPTIGAGSMILFSESLVHSAVPVLSDERRVASITKFAVPWFADDMDVTPPPDLARLIDDDLRSIFRPPTAESDESE